MRDQILQGDVLERLSQIKDNTIDCVVTSPPYFALRDYGMKGQIGLEKSPEQFIEKLVTVFREIRRVLKKEGTLWLNLGDSYANKSAPGGSSAMKRDRRKLANLPKVGVPKGLKSKDLIGIPWRVALALQADGWYLRQDIIWHKPNPMPESVSDRCTKSHEYVFLMSKSATYYFDQDSIREPAIWGSEDRYARIKADHKSAPDSLKNGLRSRKVPPVGNWGRGDEPRSAADFAKESTKMNRKSQPKGSFEGKTGDKAFRKTGETRNKRSVWSITSKPFKDAHFATFPEDLILPMILAGCPQGGVVLDPFMGAGITAVVSLKNSRSYLGIELNPKYIEIAEKRLGRLTRPML